MLMKNARWLLFIVVLLASTSIKAQQVSDSLLIEFIHTNRLSDLDALINSDNVNNSVGITNEPLLFYAIQEGNLSAVKYLIKKGASIDLLVNDLNALMYCSVKDKSAIGQYLISIGANVNALNSRRNTALMYAARYGRVSVVKLLLDNGANTEIKNITNISALDYAEKYSAVEASALIRLATESKYIPFKSNFQDGPFIFPSGFSSYYVDYLKFDSLSQKFSRVSESFKFKKGASTLFVNSFIGEIPIYFKQSRKFRNEIKSYSKIFAVGDVHGEYDSLCVLLKNNGIIDQNSNWIFGNGTLLFVGDIFDRGAKVTETLWLIYKLQNQSEDSDGSVFWILGNHDIMELEGDTRYLNNNYLLLTTKNEISYKELFGPETILGKWIRQQHSVIRIGNILFSHAGISPALVKSNFKISDVNTLVNKYLFRIEIEQFEANRITLLLGENGPFWYRGYMLETNFSKKLETDEVLSINKFFNVDFQVFGHTEVDSISPKYNNSVIPIDVSFNSPRIPMQALYIEGNKFYRALGNGNKILILDKN